MSHHVGKKWLLGVGFDHRDGHKRLSKGDNFMLIGGSKDTHDEMREKVIKLNEELKKKRKSLDSVSDKELLEVSRKVGLHPNKMNRPGSR